MITPAKSSFRQKCWKRLCSRGSHERCLRKSLLQTYRIAWLRCLAVVVERIQGILILCLSILRSARIFSHTAQSILMGFMRCFKAEWLDKLARVSNLTNIWVPETLADQVAAVAESELLVVKVAKLLCSGSSRRLSSNISGTNSVSNSLWAQLTATKTSLWTLHLTYLQLSN